jgi:hypothetical protein
MKQKQSGKWISEFTLKCTIPDNHIKNTGKTTNSGKGINATTALMFGLVWGMK